MTRFTEALVATLPPGDRRYVAAGPAQAAFLRSEGVPNVIEWPQPAEPPPYADYEIAEDFQAAEETTLVAPREAIESLVTNPEATPLPLIPPPPLTVREVTFRKRLQSAMEADGMGSLAKYFIEKAEADE